MEKMEKVFLIYNQNTCPTHAVRQIDLQREKNLLEPENIILFIRIPRKVFYKENYNVQEYNYLI